MVTVTIDRTASDPYSLWDQVRAEFGVLGMSTGPEGIRLHFAAMPDEAEIAQIAAMFEVETVGIEEE